MKNLFLKNPLRALTGLGIMLTLSIGATAAAAVNPYAPAPQSGITDLGSAFGFIDRIFNILFWLLIVLASIFIIMAAFAYLTAGGDPEKVKKANSRVIQAAIAVVIAVLAKVIPSVVCSFVAVSGCQTG